MQNTRLSTFSLYPLTKSRGKIYIFLYPCDYTYLHIFHFCIPTNISLAFPNFCTHLGPEVYFHWYYRTTTPLLHCCYPRWLQTRANNFSFPYIIVMPIFKCSFDCLIFAVSKYWIGRWNAITNFHNYKILTTCFEKFYQRGLPTPIYVKIFSTLF